MISVNNLSVIFGQRKLFDNVTLFIGKKDRIGLVGKNGAGKSTMLKALCGEQAPTTGEINIPKDVRLGYLPQNMNHNEGATIFEEASAAFSEIQDLEARSLAISTELGEREDFQSEAYMRLIEELNEVNDRLHILEGGKMGENINKVLGGLGFLHTDMDRKMSEFSGGWKMRVELSKLLLTTPDILLLDEPTNHLDIESIEWLEQYLQTYPGSILLISHDRAFLDAVTGRTVEINAGKVYDYKFSYSRYIKQRQEEMEKQVEAYKAQQKYIEDTQKLINQFRAKKNKAAFAQSLIKKLEKLDRIELDMVDNAKMRFAFPPAPRSGKVVVEANEVAKSFGPKAVFKDVNLMLARQEKIALVGKNGAGKTTFTRILLGLENQSEGEFQLGHNVSVGYYAQDQAEKLNGDKTVFETIDEEAVGDIRTRVRDLLAAFLFQGEDIDKKVKVLSGGEKARLALCKLMLTSNNLLVLDEPTNHLDMMSKDMLKNALKKFDGTLIVVSHDRDFLSSLTEVVYEITPSGLKQYLGDIYDFLNEKRAVSIAQFEADVVKKQKAKETNNSGNKQSYEERKAEEKRKRKLTNKVARCEKELEEVEHKISAMDEVIANLDYTNQEEANKKLAEYADLKKKSEEIMEAWEEAEKEMSAL